jgi:uncharacterized membrane protein YidH (DUF202 family)
VPAIAKGTTWPYALIGAGFAAVGVVCVVYAEQRRRAVDRAARAGEFVSLSTLVATILVVAGILLGVALTIIALTEL